MNTVLDRQTFNFFVRVIQSCETTDQLNIAEEWIGRSLLNYEFYITPSGQKINDAMILEVMSDIKTEVIRQNLSYVD